MKTTFAILFGANMALCGTTVALTDCTPAQEAAWIQVEHIVLEQLTKGAALSLIEEAIRAYVPKGADLDVIINNAISYLQSINAIPTEAQSTALARQTEISMKMNMKETVK